MSVVGIDLLSVEMKVVVASIETYLLYADRLDLRYLPSRG